MKIWVAMCTYNGEAYVEEQLESIAGQTTPPAGLTIVDDASTDRTLSVVQRFASDVEFPVRVLRNGKNVGYLRNFERAIQESLGDVIALADQDDLWEPHKLERLRQAFASNPQVTLAFSDAMVVDRDLVPLGFRLWKGIDLGPRRLRAIERSGAFGELLRRNFVTGATMAFRADLRPLVLPVPDGTVHDGWIALLAAAAGRVRAIPAPLIRYRQHGANVIGVRQEPLLNRIRQTAEERATALERLLAQHRLARTRLALEPWAIEAVAGLDTAIAHLEVRVVALRNGRRPPLAREWLGGRYRRCSRGTAAFALDLFARRQQT